MGGGETGLGGECVGKGSRLRLLPRGRSPSTLLGYPSRWTGCELVQAAVFGPAPALSLAPCLAAPVGRGRASAGERGALSSCSGPSECLGLCTVCPISSRGHRSPLLCPSPATGTRWIFFGLVAPALVE